MPFTVAAAVAEETQRQQQRRLCNLVGPVGTLQLYSISISKGASPSVRPSSCLMCSADDDRQKSVIVMGKKSSDLHIESTRTS